MQFSICFVELSIQGSLFSTPIMNHHVPNVLCHNFFMNCYFVVSRGVHGMASVAKAVEWQFMGLEKPFFLGRVSGLGVYVEPDPPIM